MDGWVWAGGRQEDQKLTHLRDTGGYGPHAEPKRVSLTSRYNWGGELHEGSRRDPDATPAAGTTLI